MRTEPLAIRLAYRPPFAAAPLARALRAHAVPGLEVVEAEGRHTRVILARGGPGLVTVDLRAAAPEVTATLRLADPRDLPGVTAAIRRWLDLDADPASIAAALGGDPVLAPLLAARPGLRVLGSTDGFETAVLAVLGQQVSLAAARTFAGRLVAAFGCPAMEGLAAFPTAAVLAAAGPERLRAAAGVTGARARTVHALATATGDGLVLSPGADPLAVRERLLSLPGVGPWTADIVALRALGDRDAFTSGDLVLRRALGAVSARAAAERGEAWRPYRAYALTHLWTREVFS